MPLSNQCKFCAAPVPSRGQAGYRGFVCAPCFRDARRKKYATDEVFRERVASVNKAHPKKALYSRANKLKARYGLSQGEYAEMLAAQDNVCAICYQPETRKRLLGGVVNLSVDHDHTTGKIRALLCQACNLIIGASRENTETLTRAKEYLDYYHSN